MSVVSNVGAQVDLRLRQGADFGTLLTFTNADGSPVDLTGCALAAQVRKGVGQAQLYASFYLTIETPPTLGLARMSLPAAQSALLPAVPDWLEEGSSYWWDLEMTDATGLISSPLYGKVFVLREITQ